MTNRTTLMELARLTSSGWFVDDSELTETMWKGIRDTCERQQEKDFDTLMPIIEAAERMYEAIDKSGGPHTEEEGEAMNDYYEARGIKITDFGRGE